LANVFIVTGLPSPRVLANYLPTYEPDRDAMKLLRTGPPGAEKPAALVGEDLIVDLSDVVADFDEEFFGEDGIDGVRSVVAERKERGEARPLGVARIGAPIARPHQIICVGLNYSDHAAETGQAVPEEPILFTKSPNTLVGPHDDVRIPRGSTKPDWEVELGIVIGRRTSYLDSVDQARDAIAGWVLVNDVSERAFQMERGGQWLKGKSAETFNPAGPWLVTRDEVENVLALDMWLEVNGIRRQHGSTSTMIFDPYFIVHYISQFLVLEPGDLINTGTPPGVGMGYRPPVWLQPGDVMELGITGLGQQRQKVLAPR
jgi:2,4-diketo-3-deoxy-L-fuconate hydrolase